MNKTLAIAGCAVLSALALSGCSTLGGSPLAGAGAPQAFADNLAKFNEAAAKNCIGGGDFSWNPPLPPTGNLHLHCEIGTPATPQLPPALAAALAQLVAAAAPPGPIQPAIPK